MDELSRTRTRGRPRHNRSRRLRWCCGRRLPRRLRLPGRALLAYCVQYHRHLRGRWRLRNDQSWYTRRSVTRARLFLPPRRLLRHFCRSRESTGCIGAPAADAKSPRGRARRGPLRGTTLPRVADVEYPSSEAVVICFEVVDPSFEVVDLSSESLALQLVLAELINADVTTSPPVCCEIEMSTAGSAN